MQHAGEARGACLAHSGAPPDYPDYLEAAAARGEAAAPLAAMEGAGVAPSLLNALGASPDGRQARPDPTV